MAQLLDAGIQRVRRLSVELRPGMLDDLGLVPALEWLAEEFTAHSGVPCHMTVSDILPDVDDPLRTTLYRVAQEALTNAARHAGASQVWLTLDGEEGWVRLQVRDDGRGITPEEAASPHALGLLGMRERVRARGGVLEITGRPGQGTWLTVRAPLRPTSPPGEKPSGAEATTE
ncbi:MAG: sensor histidine kinase [Caldilineae bacterium]|nr:MAG: sensor histidine kinase [Caldilineae bacterium]